MSVQSSNLAISRQVEDAALGIETFSILPDIICSFLSKLNSMQLVPAQLGEMLESDPTLTFLVLRLMQKQNLRPDENFSVLGVLDKITIKQIRDSLLVAKMTHPANEQEKQNADFAKAMQRHALLTACCAEEIVFQTSAAVNQKHAYFAGLFHNIGNLAVNEQMPKSFLRLVEEAKSENKSLCELQQQNIALDYPVIGKRMLQKFHIPEPILMGVWLHTLDTVTITKSVPEARIAQIVQMADLAARQTGFGNSFNFDDPQISDELMQSLNADAELIEQIKQKSLLKAEAKIKQLGIDGGKDYTNILRETAASLAADNTRLTGELLKSHSLKAESEFAAEVLENASADKSTVKIAEIIAACWQKHYHTGPICIYTVNKDRTVDITFRLDASNTQSMTINAPENAQILPKSPANFAVLDAKETGDWLFAHLPSAFSKQRARMIPLAADGQAAGMLVFEMRYPVPNEKLLEMYKKPASFSAMILQSSINSTYNQYFIENLIRAFKPSANKIISQPAPVPAEIPKAPVEEITPAKAVSEEKPANQITTNLLDVLAEMAAGAAHELNNPLVVISGRAQLLEAGETDPDKKRILKQITENASDLAGIIDDLMAFAMPQEPIVSETDAAQITEEAAALTAEKTKLGNINIRQQIAPDCPKIYADSGQIVSAIANILANAVESYAGEPGEITITAEPAEQGRIKLQIADRGCGMDEHTLKNAMNPFYSAKQAGRKRGMGLAHANRLIQLNGGTLNLESKLGEGTTAVIILPAAS